MNMCIFVYRWNISNLWISGTLYIQSSRIITPQWAQQWRTEIGRVIVNISFPISFNPPPCHSLLVIGHTTGINRLKDDKGEQHSISFLSGYSWLKATAMTHFTMPFSKMITVYFVSLCIEYTGHHFCRVLTSNLRRQPPERALYHMLSSHMPGCPTQRGRGPVRPRVVAKTLVETQLVCVRLRSISRHFGITLTLQVFQR